MRRRDFLKASAAAVVVVSSPWLAHAERSRERLRVGLIGTGLRGQVHLAGLLKREDVEVAAICDTEQFMLDSALKRVADAGKGEPRLYTGSNDAWRRMLNDGKLDAVVIATPWEWHAPQAIAAMEAGIAVGCEVVAGITLEDHWRVLRTHLRTRTVHVAGKRVLPPRRDGCAQHGAAGVVRRDRARGGRL